MIGNHRKIMQNILPFLIIFGFELFYRHIRKCMKLSINEIVHFLFFFAIIYFLWFKLGFVSTRGFSVSLWAIYGNFSDRDFLFDSVFHNVLTVTLVFFSIILWRLLELMIAGNEVSMLNHKSISWLLPSSSLYAWRRNKLAFF